MRFSHAYGFSDGNVWPTIRVKEAYLEGLDVIAITDHIEYRPHSQDIPSDHNRSYEIAKPLADRLGIVLIQGTEITRQMPPGHLNAIFIDNANLLEREDWFEACKEAKEQGGFVFWNHPGWKAQQPDKTLWWKEHTRLLEAGILDGIEICNYNNFYPEALEWALEKDLAMLCNSDVHDPTNLAFDVIDSHRPVTLVFASDKSKQALREALENRRTAAYYENQLVGKREYLAPIFSSSIEVVSELPKLENKKVAYIRIHNHSDVDFKLKQGNPSIGFSATKEIDLKAHKTSTVVITGTSDEVKNSKNLKLYYDVQNLMIGRDESLPVVLEVQNF